MRLLLLFLSLLAVYVVASAEEVGVLVRFGLSDRAPTAWDGSVSVSAGKVDTVTGWRFTSWVSLSSFGRGFTGTDGTRI